MKNLLIKLLLLGTFCLAVLTPDWKTQLMAQAGGCTPFDWAQHPEGCGYGPYNLDGNYKGARISEELSQ